MSRAKLAFKSGSIGMLSQVINMLFQLVIRTLFIRVFGKEILGLDGVLVDTISMLSLAELGVTSAMQFRLYVPVINKEKNRIDELMASYKIIYRAIAGVIVVLGIILSFFLPKIIMGLTVSWTLIYIAFFLYVGNSVSSYLLAYKRILFNADQKKHYCVIVDTISTIFFGLAKILIIVVLHNYIFYLGLSIVQTIVSNIIIVILSKKVYPHIGFCKKYKQSDIVLIFKDVKEILANKIAGYIYNSTDNLIISVFLGTVTVGFLSNYKYISTAIKSLVNSAMTTVEPIIGNFLNSDIDYEKSYTTLKNYTFVRFVIAGCFSIPFFTLSNKFILLWTGSESYILPRIITLLLVIDFYIGCVYGPLSEYITAMGKFKWGKYPMFCGAIANISISILLVKPLGCTGVLIGTIISQFIIWIGDTYIVFFKYFDSRRYLFEYIRKQLLYATVMVLSGIVAKLLLNWIACNSIWLEFIIGGFVSVGVFVLFTVTACGKITEYNYFLNFIKNR